MRRSTLSPGFWRRFAIAALLGVAVEFGVHLAGHKAHLAPVVALENWGTDVMTRLTGTACGFLGTRETDRGFLVRAMDLLLRCTGGKVAVATPLLVEIDDAAWRDPAWAGGEPERAPKDLLAEVVHRSFDLGARIVVLDVLIEPGHSDAAPDAFANRIGKLIGTYDRHLVLVRSERSPLPEHTGAFIGQLRAVPVVDELASASLGRIVLAAPYFQVSADRITRDWELFRVTCSPAGRVHVVPSVQLVVAADYVQRLQAASAPVNAVSPEPYANRPCPVQPESRNVTLSPQALAVSRCLTLRAEHGSTSREAQPACTGMESLCDGSDGSLKTLCEAWKRPGPLGNARDVYWQEVLDGLQYGKDHGLELPEKLPASGDIGNRIIFRLPADLVDRISVLDVGVPGSQRPAYLERLFKDRIVVVGQTHAESADFFDTPVGRMPGALLLVNAIDSMNRHGVARAIPTTLELGVVALLIFIVAYCFTRWSSPIGTFTATLAIIVVAGFASFALWAQGGWLNFVAPLIGIQVHSWLASYEERRELNHLKRITGGRHGR